MNKNPYGIRGCGISGHTFVQPHYYFLSMSLKKVYNFNEAPCIQAFAFNSKMDRLALSPNNNLVNIYKLSGDSWTLESVLKEHTERVTGIDWSADSNKILTCAADRNGYVWSEEKPKEWKQSLVLLRIDRAATCAQWSPSGKKFAVGTGSKLICVCYYEESNDWWVSKHIKKPIRSTILSLDWHPTSTVIACGSSDFTVRVFSAAVKEVEKKPDPTGWGDKVAFGSFLVEYTTGHGGWIHCVKFSPSGDKLLWVSHDSCIGVADCKKGIDFKFVLKVKLLPLLGCAWASETTIFAAGHDNKPYKFTFDGNTIKEEGNMDTNVGSKKGDGGSSAMSKFKNLDKLAQETSVSKASNSTHSNTLKCMSKLPDGTIGVSGMDTQISIWA